MRKTTLVMAAVLVAVLVAAPAMAGDGGNWMFRGRLIYVSPDMSADGEMAEYDTDADGNTAAEVDFSYFFTPHWALEGALTSTSHNLKLHEEGEEFSLGGVTFLVPTFLAQYHFRPDEKFQPYVGLGFTYAMAIDQSGWLDESDVDDLDDSFGLAVQVGADVQLRNGMYLNFDIRYVEFDSDLVIEGDNLGNLEFDPFVFGIGFGWRF